MKEKLLEVHEHCWASWRDHCKGNAMYDVPPGKEQLPGVVAEHIVQSLYDTGTALPPKTKYGKKA